MSKPVGHIRGKLLFQIEGGEPIEMGTVSLPLVATRVSPPKSGVMTFGLGVDLEGVSRDIAAIFDSNEVTGDE
jgi:hypothetical protein